MNRCPKCGSYDITGPRYEPQKDVLQYACQRCGYRAAMHPLDYHDPIDLHELLRQKANEQQRDTAQGGEQRG